MVYSQTNMQPQIKCFRHHKLALLKLARFMLEQTQYIQVTLVASSCQLVKVHFHHHLLQSLIPQVGFGFW
jgi:hypothetical protein